uniref:Uncharacterized protein n=1 Tax=Corethron hystrix TaxID=216773 RepID=A0A6U5FYS0_9STRA|mmetsp:Transcript_24400/g.55700  ORF Transcript_24400/g.55700 Transcript_24400/m.55700 type:complete len:121 (+) Transcript_24400:531-893(+)
MLAKKDPSTNSLVLLAAFFFYQDDCGNGTSKRSRAQPNKPPIEDDYSYVEKEVGNRQGSRAKSKSKSQLTLKAKRSPRPRKEKQHRKKTYAYPVKPNSDKDNVGYGNQSFLRSLVSQKQT